MSKKHFNMLNCGPSIFTKWESGGHWKFSTHSNCSLLLEETGDSTVADMTKNETDPHRSGIFYTWELNDHKMHPINYLFNELVNY